MLGVMSQTSPNVVYREVGADRLDDVRPLWEALNAYHSQLSPHFAGEVDGRTFESRKREFLGKADTGKIRIDLVTAGSDAGDIAYCISSVSAKGVTEVDSLFVDARFRGRGMGTELMSRALAWFHATGATAIVVSVMHGNEQAVAFYRRFGFHPRALVMKISPTGNADNR
jgi:ribosomal protein S18 acetylase RimI-like enzyme